jgi:hypothetical protein
LQALRAVWPHHSSEQRSSGSSVPENVQAALGVRSIAEQEYQGDQRKNDAAESEAKSKVLPAGGFLVSNPFTQDGKVPVRIVVKAVIDHLHYLAMLPLGSQARLLFSG